MNWNYVHFNFIVCNQEIHQKRQKHHQSIENNNDPKIYKIFPSVIKFTLSSHSNVSGVTNSFPKCKSTVSVSFSSVAGLQPIHFSLDYSKHLN